MFKLILLSTFILSAFAPLTHAKSLELSKNSRSIFIPQKSNWELGKDLFGMPFIYFSPQVNGQRSNISFTDTGAEVELDIKSLAKSQNDYQKNKRKWSESVSADPQSFFPYEVKVNKYGHRVHKIGFSYVHEGELYVEKSNYVECRGRVIFAKSLRLAKNSAHEKDFDDLIYNLDCGGL